MFVLDDLQLAELVVCHPLEIASASTLASIADILCSKGSATVLSEIKFKTLFRNNVPLNYQ